MIKDLTTFKKLSNLFCLVISVHHKLNFKQFIKLFGETINFPFLNTHRKKYRIKEI